MTISLLEVRGGEESGRKGHASSCKTLVQCILTYGQGFEKERKRCFNSSMNHGIKELYRSR